MQLFYFQGLIYNIQKADNENKLGSFADWEHKTLPISGWSAFSGELFIPEEAEREEYISVIKLKVGP